MIIFDQFLMIIGLDFDGVIAHWAKLKSIYAKKLFSVDIPPERFRFELVVPSGALTTEQYLTLTRKAVLAPIELLEPVHDALAYIRRILDINVSTIVVTNRTGIALERAREWTFEKNLPLNLIGVDTIKNTKKEATRGFDIYVDDKLENIKPLIHTVPHRFLLTWEYNKFDDTGTIAQRAFNWKELYEKICFIADLNKKNN